MKEQKKSKPASRRKYDQDFKTESLHMIANGYSVLQVAQALGVGENLLYRWRSQQESSGTKGKEKADSPLAIENERLRHQLRQIEEEQEIKKSLSHFQPTDLRLIYQFISQHMNDHSVLLLCKVFEVSRSGFYGTSRPAVSGW